MNPGLFTGADDDDEVDYTLDSSEDVFPLEWTSAQSLTVNVAHSEGGRARCVNCLRLVSARKAVFGVPAVEPLSTRAFYCTKCAKELNVGDFDVAKWRGK